MLTFDLPSLFQKRCWPLIYLAIFLQKCSFAVDRRSTWIVQKKVVNQRSTLCWPWIYHVDLWSTWCFFFFINLNCFEFFCFCCWSCCCFVVLLFCCCVIFVVVVAVVVLSFGGCCLWFCCLWFCCLLGRVVVLLLLCCCCGCCGCCCLLLSKGSAKN